MKKLIRYTYIILSATTIFTACKKDDKEPPPTLPVVTTTAATVTGSTATTGGTITDDGRSTITASGICWSKTNAMPTIADDTTLNTVTGGSFTSIVNGLEPSATYYFRAYATNSVGTGYGSVVTINTGNGAPEARNGWIEGQANITNKIAAHYTYYDFEDDAQTTAAYQWYVANDSTSGNGTAISGATDSTYVIAAGDQNKFLRCAITPKAAAGTTTGAVAYTWWIGPVGGAPTNVKFIYNDAEVTYGIITSSTTGKKWLDRNLGAQQAATSTTDHLAYGDLFQWGRPADGHQLINWTSSTNGTSINGTIGTLADSDFPGHNQFITNSATPQDWRSDNNTNRWATRPQGPCPIGWHVPTYGEWQAEMPTGSNHTAVVNELKLAMPGYRFFQASIVLVGTTSNYWSSSLSGNSAYYASIDAAGSIWPMTLALANGHSVRCIKD